MDLTYGSPPDRDEAASDDTDGGAEVTARPWPNALVTQTTRWADTLNDRFVSLVTRVDQLIGRTEKAVNRKLGRERTAARSSERPERDVERTLARWARIRLSDLHLKVGQSLYKLDRADNSAAVSVRRQLLALLDEIERLEEVLARANGTETPPSPAEGLLDDGQLTTLRFDTDKERQP